MLLLIFAKDIESQEKLYFRINDPTKQFCTGFNFLAFIITI